jgi:WG containing repeat
MLKTLARSLRLLLLSLVVLLVAVTAGSSGQSLAPQHQWTKNIPWQGRDFSEGLAGVCYRGGARTCGYFDRQGKLALMTNFTVVQDFHGGRAAVGNGQTYGFIDKSGKTLGPLQFSQVGDFSEGLAAVLSGGKWGYINQWGKVVVPAQFAWAGEFHDGVAVVGNGVERQQGLIIDRKGQIMKTFLTHSVPPEGFRHGKLAASDKIQFSEGLVRAVNERQQVGYLNTKGQLVIPYIFDDADDFSEGLAAVRQSGDRTQSFIGYINTKGRKVIRLDAQGIPYPSPFHEGLAQVSYGFEAGPYAACEYINKQGRSLVKIEAYSHSPDMNKQRANSVALSSYSPPRCSDFHEGVAFIGSDTRRRRKYFINKSGREIFSLGQSNLGTSGFREGRAHLKFAEGFYSPTVKEGDSYIDRRGKVIFQSPPG